MANKDKTSAEPNSLAQVSDRVRNSSNILIALSKDPNIDELTAALSLAMIFDKFGKHATAIFSGAMPNIISFLQPEKTFETNTNSLQDFIIALDKDKADHIRYKIDGDFVKVFITPYKTTINEKDLEFSHGDFNVDLVIALNVKSEEELDSALVEYGRIMHDASSINISPAAPGNFGDIEWGDPMASSVSEMVYRLAVDLQDPNSPLIDENIATTILTGVISATNRFSNERTTADTLSVASNLLASGANQQLIAKNIPVDILTAQTESSTASSSASSEAKTTSVEASAEPAPKTVEESSEKPANQSELATSSDPTNFSIEHQKKQDEPVPSENKESKVKELNNVPKEADVKAETDRIAAEAQQKQADEKAKAEAEAKRKRDEEAAKAKAEAEKNQAAKEAIMAKVSAEHSNQTQPASNSMLPPQPPKEFAAHSEQPKAEEAQKASAPEMPKKEDIGQSEPTVIPNAVPTASDTILPPPPAPSTDNVMPPASPVAPAPAPAPTPAPVTASAPANTQASSANAPSEPTVIPNAVQTTPVMPSVTMPSQEIVNNAINSAISEATASIPTQSSQPTAAAPTLAPRPATPPASPVATTPTSQPAQAPAAQPAPAANPVNDPGAFHIPGM